MKGGMSISVNMVTAMSMGLFIAAFIIVLWIAFKGDLSSFVAPIFSTFTSLF